jgi:hypothetical protein
MILAFPFHMNHTLLILQSVFLRDLRSNWPSLGKRFCFLTTDWQSLLESHGRRMWFTLIDLIINQNFFLHLNYLLKKLFNARNLVNQESYGG